MYSASGDDQMEVETTDDGGFPVPVGRGGSPVTDGMEAGTHCQPLQT